MVLWLVTACYLLREFGRASTRLNMPPCSPSHRHSSDLRSPSPLPYVSADQRSIGLIPLQSGPCITAALNVTLI